MYFSTRVNCRLFAAIVLAAGCTVTYAQSSSDALIARTLYYNAGPESTPKPPRPAKRTSGTSAPAVKPAPASHVSSQPPENSAPASPSTSNASRLSAVSHLGVRYNVVLVNPSTGDETTVDPDRTFHGGDCVALNVQSNYDGYLYIVEHGSSGAWDLLLPSPLMHDESNLVPARTETRAPAHYCFSMDPSPGTEHLFVVLSRNPEDVYELNSAIRSGKAQNGGAATAPANHEQQNPIQLGQEMAQLQTRLQGRDLSITKVSDSPDGSEPAHSVYVVNVSNRPSDRIIAEIQVRHQ